MIWRAATMTMLAMGSVGLWTLRVAHTARGRKLLGAGVAAVEALVFVVAFTSLAANLDSPALLGGYAAGVALGTLVGLAASGSVDRVLLTWWSRLTQQRFW